MEQLTLHLFVYIADPTTTPATTPTTPTIVTTTTTTPATKLFLTLHLFVYIADPTTTPATTPTTQAYIVVAGVVVGSAIYTNRCKVRNSLVAGVQVAIQQYRFE